MIALEQARHHMETLGLTQAAAVLDSRLDAATQKQLSYPEVLADLLGIEAAARRERYLTTRTRLAHLPFHRSLEQFDFGFQPSVDKRQVRELASMAFVSDAANLLLLGPPGVGKTHLAKPWPSRPSNMDMEPTSFGPTTLWRTCARPSKSIGSTVA